jgi:ferredoxin
MSAMSQRTGSWLLFFAGIAYCALMLFSSAHVDMVHLAFFWALGTAIVFISSRAPSFLFDSSLLGLILLLFSLEHSIARDPVLYLPLLTMVLIHLSHRTGARSAAIITWIAVMAYYGINAQSPEGTAAILHYTLLFSSLLGLTLHSASAFMPKKAELKNIDIVLCSYSGNTAYYAEHFIQAAKNAGSMVKVHRFHFYKEFTPSLAGDALVIAFPAIGWKPPWPLVDFLLHRLPEGDGKPAFVLYTAAGGPENAGALAGVLLALKGYRIAGRSWGILPLNVPTFRIGPRGLYNFLDSRPPNGQDLKYSARSGEDFCHGRPAGMPFFVFPSPLFLIGALLDNRWLNRLLYRNYVWKRRCVKCNACVEYCPSERLSSDEEGYPRQKPGGDCALCMGCVNLCPGNAMHMLCFTEYGNPYRARWPEFVVRKKESIRSEENED